MFTNNYRQILAFPDELIQTTTSEGYFKLEKYELEQPEALFDDVDDNPKNSYVLLLIDGRIWSNLPVEWKDQEHLIWGRFLDSIFYVGKGTGTRDEQLSKQGTLLGKKLEMKDWSNVTMVGVEKIVSFYKQQNGTLLLSALSQFINNEELQIEAKMLENMGYHLAMMGQKFEREKRMMEIGEENIITDRIFENISDAQAYTRAAVIIQALGFENLTNARAGSLKIKEECRDAWTQNRQIEYGIAILHAEFKKMLKMNKVPFALGLNSYNYSYN